MWKQNALGITANKQKQIIIIIGTMQATTLCVPCDVHWNTHTHISKPRSNETTTQTEKKEEALSETV